MSLGDLPAEATDLLAIGMLVLYLGTFAGGALVGAVAWLLKAAVERGRTKRSCAMIDPKEA